MVELLKPRQSRGKRLVWVDGTVGAGGHAAAVLKAVADAEAEAWIVGTDRDAEMLKFARHKLHDFLLDRPDQCRVDLCHASYANLPDVMAQLGVKPNEVDVIFLDLGVNSLHFDAGARGFSFQNSGPLDMRFDTSSGQTAAEFLQSVSEEDLAAILRDDGEERFAKRIARAIKQHLAEKPFHTTAELAEVVKKASPPAKGGAIHPATRTFQALRIAVNDEFKHLRKFLADFPNWIGPGGRVGIITFHSLEDRLVKQAFAAYASGASPATRLPIDLPLTAAQVRAQSASPRLRLLNKKPIVAGADEVARNPRARSAKLRGVQML